jgi:ribosomal protein S18 acetylase RimI-like enzyme
MSRSSVNQPLEIRLGLPDTYRWAAAELCYDAFQQKFEPILNSTELGVGILEAGLKSEQIMIAVQNQQLVGVVGLEYSKQYFFDLKTSAFVQAYGRLRGIIKMILFLPFAQHHHDGELTIGAIAVSPAMRGHGVGTQLLDAVFDYAREHDFRSVSLEVVDTNPHARQLYQRMGFAVIKTRHYPYLKRLMGFSAVTAMRKDIV